MSNKLSKLLFVLFLVSPIHVLAQDWHTQYLDSLTKLKQQTFDSDSFRLTRPEFDAEMTTKSMVLFTPLAYYHTPVEHLLGFQNNGRGDSLINESLDKTLMNIYLKRPDLVKIRESELDAHNKIESSAYEMPQQHHPDIVEKVVPVADEPEVTPMDVLVSKPNFWNFAGEYNLQFMQNYISGNWYKGGESNYSMLGNVIFQANYNNKQKVKWENKLEAKLGAQTSKADTVHSFKVTTDVLRLTSKLGFQATNRWYYTLQMIGTTQMSHTYSTNSNVMTASWFSPFVLNTSVGMDYSAEWFKKKLTGTIHLAPFATNWKYIDKVSMASRYGIDTGKHNLLDWGSELTVDLKWNFTDNISWKTRLYGYTTYKRAELEWENTFVFKFNKYISTNLFVYPRFDDGTTRDNDFGYWEMKEYFSLGFNYSF